MVDMSRTIVPKSDQLNADDLIAGPRTIVIRDVKEMNNAEQPIAIYFEGDNGKPYKPCKSMRRALVYVWGDQGMDYIGRAMTLYLDPDVTWGNERVGGIRISHMSHIDGPMDFPLSASKTKRIRWEVKPLRRQESQQQRPKKTTAEMVDGYEAAVSAAEDLDALSAITGGEGAAKLRERIDKEGGDQAAGFLQRMTDAGSQRYAAISSIKAEDGPDPGPSDGSFFPQDEDDPAGHDAGDDLDDDLPPD